MAFPHCLYMSTRTARIVLEDLQSSTEWRLAEPADMERAATGVALAEWYRNLHQAGREALKDSSLQPEGVFPWVSEITGPSLEKAGAALKLEHTPAWGMAMQQVEILKGKYLALPQTFNYNDFAAENLALSREPGAAPCGRSSSTTIALPAARPIATGAT